MRNLISRVPLLVWFLLPTFVLIGVGVWFLGRGDMGTQKDSDAPLAVSRPVDGTVEFPVVNRTHINEGSNGTDYNSNPPTSGPHWPQWSQNGIVDNSEADERYIHNLEHGYVWISYKSDVGQDTIDKLKEIVKSDDWKIIMAPRDKNDSKIALAAWGRVLNMDSLDEAKVKDFISTYRNRAPERTPD